MSNQIELLKQQAYLQAASESALSVQSVSLNAEYESFELEATNCKGTAGTLGSLGCACGCFGTFGSAGSYGCGA